MEAKNAKISSTMLGFEDHGIFTFTLFLDYGGAGQGYGNFSLGGTFTDAAIREVLNTVGVKTWEDLPGKVVRVQANHSEVSKLGNYLTDKWLDLAELAREHKDDS